MHLKGSGRTPYARGGDGKAAVGPMLREFVIGEAMHALGVPTTRALAVVATGDDVIRETVLPGAVLSRVAASHLRVGTFQYASALDDATVLQRLADHAISRHHPAARDAERPYVALYEAVLEAQAALVARWMLVGFIHGVMNTDNMAISGETIDYGPCAFMDAFDPATVFSSIDHGGRYAYGNQPPIAQWNLARLAEAMLPLLGANGDEAVEVATEVLQTFPARYAGHWVAGMRAKLGLGDEQPGDRALIDDLLAVLHEQQIDYTTAMRSLSAAACRRCGAGQGAVRPAGGVRCLASALGRRLGPDPAARAAIGAAMDRVNPVYVPRNHLVEEALAAATGGDLTPFERLLDVVTDPYVERPGLERYAVTGPRLRRSPTRRSAAPERSEGAPIERAPASRAAMGLGGAAPG